MSASPYYSATDVIGQLSPGPVPALNVAVVGYGTVGTAVVRIITNEHPRGLKLTHICNRAIRRKKSDSVPGRVIWTERFDDVLGPDVDIVVELIGGEDDALTLIKDALARGKSVVTANKKIIAKYGSDLQRLAQENGAQLLYGGSVAGGVPVLPGLNAGLSGDRIVALRGVVNGTCNFILSKLEQGAGDFDAALEEAKNLGYAEAEPSDDIDSFDAQAKLAILSRVAFGADVEASAITRKGIRSISPFDFECARQIGCTIRQVARATVSGPTLRAAVTPALVPLTSPLARVHGNQNVVIATGLYGGDMVFCGAGAGGNATAVAVVSDLLSIATRPGQRNGWPQQEAAATNARPTRVLRVAEEEPAKHVVRCRINRASAIAVLVETLTRNGINTEAVVQGASSEKTSLVAITVAPCGPVTLEKALVEIHALDGVVDVPSALPLLS